MPRTIGIPIKLPRNHFLALRHRDITNPLDPRSNLAQFLLDSFITSVHMVDTVEYRLAIRH